MVPIILAVLLVLLAIWLGLSISPLFFLLLVLLLLLLFFY
jgi:hypothetical protein